METLLKSEFKKRDITRARNLLKKRYGDKTVVQSGYERREVSRSEGDVWEENGKSWTIKDGIKISVNKFSDVRKLTIIPLCCPQCGGSLKHHLARKSYQLYGFCFDPCLIEFEVNLRERGLYESYEKSMRENNVAYFKKELLAYLSERVKFSNSYVSKDGDVEDWEGDKTIAEKRFTKNVKEYLGKIGT